MKTGVGFFKRDHANIRVDDSVQALGNAVASADSLQLVLGQIKVRDLSLGVNAFVGSTGHSHAKVFVVFAKNFDEPREQFTGNRSQI